MRSNSLKRVATTTTQYLVVCGQPTHGLALRERTSAWARASPSAACGAVGGAKDGRAGDATMAKARKTWFESRDGTAEGMTAGVRVATAGPTLKAVHHHECSTRCHQREGRPCWKRQPVQTPLSQASETARKTGHQTTDGTTEEGQRQHQGFRKASVSESTPDGGTRP